MRLRLLRCLPRGPSPPWRPGVALTRTRIKICGLTREQDVDAAVAAGADAVGFVLYAKSPRHVTARRAAELARRLPPFVTPVLLFVNDSADSHTRCLRSWFQAPPCNFMVTKHRTSAGRRSQAPAPSCVRPVFHWVRPGGGFDLVKFAQDYLSRPGHPARRPCRGLRRRRQTFDWSLLPPNVNAHLVLSGGLTPANVTDGILQVRPRCKSLAVDVSSGVEASKGIKNADKINQFVAAFALRTNNLQG